MKHTPHQVSISRPKHFVALGLVLGLVFLINLLTLDHFPAPFVDEGWMASRAQGYIQTGLVFGDVDRYIFDYYDGYWTFLPARAYAQ